MRDREQRYHLVLLFGHVSIVAVSVVFALPQVVVLITLARFYCRWLQFLCNKTQHIGLPDKVPDFRICCRTFTLNPLIRFLYWNMNYHVEHHMYAAVPCYNLHRLHKRIRSDLPWCPRGLVATWLHIGRVLRRQQREPGYRYVAEVPA